MLLAGPCGHLFLTFTKRAVIPLIERRQKTGRTLMNAMRDFWAREWLLRFISMRHETNDVDKIIELAQLADYLDDNAELTEIGKSFIAMARHDDEKVILAEPIVQSL